MSVGRIASIGALLTGVVWVAAGVLGWGGDPEEYSYLAGLALFVLSLAAFGYSLVATAPVWLRVLVTLATPALGYTVWLVVRDSVSDGYLPVLFAGVVLVVAGGIGLGRGRGEDSEPDPPARGRRAAR